MSKYRLVLSSCLLAVLTIVLAIATVGCGSSAMTSNRVLQSMVLAPANADAMNFPNGQVQFLATGTFSKTPSPAQVTFQPPYTGSWSLMGTSASSIATISPTGLAQCILGAAGTVTVNAIVSANAAMGTGATSVAVQGSTTLTCP